MEIAIRSNSSTRKVLSRTETQIYHETSKAQTDESTEDTTETDMGSQTEGQTEEQTETEKVYNRHNLLAYCHRFIIMVSDPYHCEWSGDFLGK